MKYLYSFIFCWSAVASFAQVSLNGMQDCKTTPAFIYSLKNFDTENSALSTMVAHQIGLVLLEQTREKSGSPKMFQDSTWDDAGNLGPMVIDYMGNAYLAPMPKINTYLNQKETLNSVFIMDSKTGKMKKLISIPGNKENYNKRNPYGILGLGYDCDEHILYVTSVFNSGPQIENGEVFKINLLDTSVTKIIEGFDGYGISVAKSKGEKRLFIGKARSGEIISYPLKGIGSISESPKLEFSLEGLGPRGDDKVRKIKALPNGDLLVYGFEFYFNLIAPSEKPETQYTFRYNQLTKSWLLVNWK